MKFKLEHTRDAWKWLGHNSSNKDRANGTFDGTHVATAVCMLYPNILLTRAPKNGAAPFSSVYFTVNKHMAQLVQKGKAVVVEPGNWRHT